MTSRHHRIRTAVAVAVASGAAAVAPIWAFVGPASGTAPPSVTTELLARGTEAVVDWNVIALRTTLAAPLNPPLESRNVALVQAAVFERGRLYQPDLPVLRDTPAQSPRSLGRGGGRHGRLRGADRLVPGAASHARCLVREFLGRRAGRAGQGRGDRGRPGGGGGHAVAPFVGSLR